MPMDVLRGEEACGADPARLRAIRRHLASFLPTNLLERFWHEGFAAPRQPSFRFNALRLGVGAGGAGASHATPSSCTAAATATAAATGFDNSIDGDVAVEEERAVVRELLAGFGLPADTPLERCPYWPRARLLPSHTAGVVRVADGAHTLGPLRRGTVYLMGLSSMLPALALMVPALTLMSGAGPVGQPAAAPGQPPPGSGHPHPHPQQHRCQPTRLSAPHLHQQQHQSQQGMVDRVHDTDGGGPGGGRRAASPALRVLDLCAAPGGKSALLAELMGNRGTLLAVDASWPRLQRLQFNLDRLVPHPGNGWGGGATGGGDGNDGTSLHKEAATRPEAAAAAVGGGGARWWRRGCVVAVHADGATLRVDEHGLPLARQPGRRGGPHRAPYDMYDDPDEEGEFGLYDRVLVDAPCSGLGRLQLHRPSSYSRWDERLGAGHPERQRQLLLRGARLLRRGGSLVYSTCTIDPRENEAVVAWLLRRADGSLRLVEPQLPAVRDPREATQPNGLEPVTSTPLAAAHAAAAASLPLRAALEAHRPGCTYPPLLDGAWWCEVAAGGRRVDVGGGGGRTGRALRRVGGGGGGAVAAAAAAGCGLSAAELREQLASCCVRLAPGPTYEGFFLAQFVRE